ncbi:hypothetical protein L7F22_034120 [Adiantum nelumboides]|nr:hypothetical protein [Adiantum nelumboides]
MDKDSDTVKRMRWRYDKLLQPLDFVDKKMRDMLVIPQTRKEEANSLKIRDVTHPRQTRAKAAYDEVMAHTQIELKKSQALAEDDDYINETRRMNSRNQSLLREYPDGVYMYLNMSDGERCLSLNASDIEILRNPKAELLDTIVYAGINVLRRLLATYDSLVGDHSLYDSEIKAVPVKEQTNSVSCGWRCILHAEYILHALFDHKEHFMGKNCIKIYSNHFLLQYRAQIISDMLEVSQAKTVDNAPLFPDMEDIELMLAFGDGGVSQGVALEEMEEQGGMVEVAKLDAPSVVEDVCPNQMKEMGATREEAAVGVPPVAYEVPIKNKEEYNMHASILQEEIGGTREQTEARYRPADEMEEVRNTREQPKVEVSLMTDNVVAAEPAERIEEVGVTKEEQELGVSPITKHMVEEKSADQQHPVDLAVQEKPKHSSQREMEHEKKDTTEEQEQQNEEEEEDQQSTVKDNAFDKSP